VATKTKKKGKKSKAKAKKPSPMPKLGQFTMTPSSSMEGEGLKEYTATRIINKRCFMAKVKGGRVSDVFCWVKDTEGVWTWALINRGNPENYEAVVLQWTKKGKTKSC
jgi:hypothetical protein